MEIHTYKRSWETTENIIKKEFHQKYGREIQQDEFMIELRDRLKRGLVETDFIDKIDCHTKEGYDSQTFINKLISQKSSRPVFNQKIQNSIEQYLSSLISGKSPADHPKFDIIFDRINTPTRLYNVSIPGRNLRKTNVLLEPLLEKGIFHPNTVVVHLYDLIFENYWHKNDRFDIEIDHDILTNSAKNTNLISFEDYLTFEGGWSQPINYSADQRSKSRISQTGLLSRKYYFNYKKIINVGFYMVYQLLRKCLEKRLNIVFINSNRNVHKLICLFEHFQKQLSNYSISYYFPVLNYDQLKLDKVKILKKTGDYQFSEIIKSAEMIFQNSLIYFILYADFPIFLYDCSVGGELYQIKNCQPHLIANHISPNPSINLEKNLKLATFVCQNIQTTFARVTNLKYEFDPEASADKNEDNFKQSSVYPEMESQLDQIFEKYTNRSLFNSVASPKIIFIYGPPASGKTTYTKTILAKKYPNYLSLSKDELTVELPGYLQKSAQIVSMISEKYKFLENYDPQIREIILRTLLLQEKHKIYREYVQYGLLLFYRILSWCLKNKITVVNDLAGMGDLTPITKVIDFAKSSPYTFELVAIHTNFEDQYLNQVYRSKFENRYFDRQTLLNATNKSFTNLYDLIFNQPIYQKLNFYLIDNTKNNFKLIYSKISNQTSVKCESESKDETEFVKIWNRLCPEVQGAEPEFDSFPNFGFGILIVILIILIFILIQYCFNFLSDFSFFAKDQNLSN